jgi:hypothetical protein
MSRLVDTRLHRVNVRDQPSAVKAVCTRIHSALAADFAGMRQFNANNNKLATLGSCEEAQIWVHQNLFVVPVNNVTWWDATMVAEETAQFGGNLFSENGRVYLSIAMPSRLSWTRVAMILLLIVVVATAVYKLLSTETNPLEDNALFASVYNAIARTWNAAWGELVKPRQ